MFADSDDEEVKAKRKAREERKKQKTVATVAAAAAAPQSIDRPPAAATAPAAAAPPQPSPTEEEEEDYGAWPVRELQRFVQVRGKGKRNKGRKDGYVDGTDGFFFYFSCSVTMRTCESIFPFPSPILSHEKGKKDGVTCFPS